MVHNVKNNDLAPPTETLPKMPGFNKTANENTLAQASTRYGDFTLTGNSAKVHIGDVHYNYQGPSVLDERLSENRLFAGFLLTQPVFEDKDKQVYRSGREVRVTEASLPRC